METLTIGILAHVDAGKTTLSEAFLTLADVIKRPGRVDNRDTVFDNQKIERERKITVFAKEISFSRGQKQFTLVDTPGHTDFSAETERTLAILDYAILLVSATDGVKGHTRTLWRLLKRYNIPVFIFVNKMDQQGADRTKALADLRENLSKHCVAFDRTDKDFLESVAVCDDAVLEQYLETERITGEQIGKMIQNRSVFPCFFGSALKLTGVEDLLNALESYTCAKKYPPNFGATVFKISRDQKNNRLTHLKVTGGTLFVRQAVSGTVRENREETWQEKVSQIFLYSNGKLVTADTVPAGTVCAVTGLTKTYAGQGLGAQSDSLLPLIAPMLSYRLNLPENANEREFYLQCRMLEEEDPSLAFFREESSGQIFVQLMGQVQTEVLAEIIADRFGITVSFDEGKVIYRETILDSAEGVGHFEPLRHYAEVHVFLEPAGRGSGIQVENACSTDQIPANYSRQICKILAQKEHAGVLSGAPLTDVKMTLVSARAHQKHTEGGDFLQATCRAVRQGLMKVSSELLEPFVEFTLKIPQAMSGRALCDIKCMSGNANLPVQEKDFCTITGLAPAATMQNYGKTVSEYTKGCGQFSAFFAGFFPCHNTREVLDKIAYRPENDADHPASSVFCAHGSGFTVPWDQVEDYMHLPLVREKERIDALPQEGQKKKSAEEQELFIGEDEINRIIEKTAYANRKKDAKHPYKKTQKKTVSAQNRERSPEKKQTPKERFLLVDGYNMVFAKKDLKSLAQTNIDAAREKLTEILCNYQAYDGCRLVVVFDAYRVKGGEEKTVDTGNITVVYTKEGMTADQYIERFVGKLIPSFDVTVVTSDGLEQLTVSTQGSKLLSAREFYEEIARVNRQIADRIDS